jgi:large subunit ribosomal protein L25
MNGKLLNAELRTETGKNSCNRLRVEGYIPAVVYSHGKSDVIKIKEKEFSILFKGHISESVIFNLHVNGAAESEMMAFVKDFQADPVTGRVLHLDLFKVTKGEKIKTHVPVELVGSPKGIKMGGILEHGERELYVHCRPGVLPEKITVDISELGVGESVHVSDIRINEEIEILTSGNSLIAAVERPRTAEEAPASEGEEAPSAE